MSGSTTISKLPSDEPLGQLEPVAFFNGAMPIGMSIA